jgi:hypothetical protein
MSMAKSWYFGAQWTRLGVAVVTRRTQVDRLHIALAINTSSYTPTDSDIIQHMARICVSNSSTHTRNTRDLHAKFHINHKESL